MSETRPTPESTASVSEAMKSSDASCRDAGLLLFWMAATWAVAGALLGLLSSLKFHGPGMGSGAVLTYGRVYPASNFLLFYGALAQAAIGVMLWLIARLSGRPLASAWMVLPGGLSWNLGVLSGAGAILTGNATGISGFEIPRGPAVMMLAGYCAMALPGLLTLMTRRDKPWYVSECFLLAALFWFPWAFSTAILFIHVFPARGMMLVLVGEWQYSNLSRVWLALIAYAVLFYMVPKLARRPLESGPTAAFTFWLTVFFSSWIAVPPGSPVPAWLQGVSGLAAMVSVAPMLAAVTNLRATCGDQAEAIRSQPGGICFLVSIPCLLVASLLQAGASFRGVADVLGYTFFEMGLHTVFTGGFVGLTVLGAVLFALPRLTGVPWGAESMISMVGKLATGAVVVVGVSLLGAGILQGFAAADVSVPFETALKRGMGPFRLSTLGWLAGVGAAVVVWMQITALGWKVCSVCCIPPLFREMLPAGKAKKAEVAA
ncbi:MAG: hypothetical protein FJ404_04290 [Verrucomicrobia bacterium]|nr:hypothetical protein [Verrucomicrobiota bacterium]